MDQATCSSTMHISTSQEMQFSDRTADKCPLETFLRSKKLKMKGKGSNKRIPALNFGDIKIGSRLGKGSFTKVHAISSVTKTTAKAILARRHSSNGSSSSESSNSSSKDQFVIKRLRVSASAAGEKALKLAFHQLIGEATLLAQLDHPQIAKLRAFISTPDDQKHGFALIVDRWDCTLREKIDKQWVGANNEDATFVSERLCYALEIADALEYLHHRRLIYRNLEPRNVGFTKDGSVQLFDFGLCRRLPKKSRVLPGPDKCYKMTYAGTARYLAPEVHRKSGGYNLKADVYSWAIVCYEMMSLTEPYQGMSRQEHLAEVCDEGFRPCMDDLPSCSDLENLLHQTWCDDLSKRLTMKKVCAALEDIVSCIDPETSTMESLNFGGFEDDDDEDDEYEDDDKHESFTTFSTLSDYSWLTDDEDDLMEDDYSMDLYDDNKSC